MNRLITDLLDLARIREGRVEIEVREEHTSALLAEAMDQSAPMAEQRPVHLANDGGPDGVVICDRERVLQVFDNIVGNAIKFSPPGKTVRLAVESSPDECTFAVRDAGPGIPEQELPLLFDRFLDLASGHQRHRHRPRARYRARYRRGPRRSYLGRKRAWPRDIIFLHPADFEGRRSEGRLAVAALHFWHTRVRAEANFRG